MPGRPGSPWRAPDASSGTRPVLSPSTAFRRGKRRGSTGRGRRTAEWPIFDLPFPRSDIVRRSEFLVGFASPPAGVPAEKPGKAGRDVPVDRIE